MMPCKISKHFYKVYGHHLCIFVVAAKKGSYVAQVGLELPVLLRIIFPCARITRTYYPTQQGLFEKRLSMCVNSWVQDILLLKPSDEVKGMKYRHMSPTLMTLPMYIIVSKSFILPNIICRAWNDLLCCIVQQIMMRKKCKCLFQHRCISPPPPNTFHPYLIDSMETKGQLYRHICNKLKFLVCLKQQFASEKKQKNLEISLIIMTDITREYDGDCNASLLSLLTPLERNNIFMLFRFAIYLET